MRRFINTLAVSFLLALVIQGPSLAQTLEGAMAKFNARDYGGALKEWQALADEGNPDAQFNLGQMYRLGQGISFDFPKAEANYRLAASSGHTAAQRELGNLYFFSIGTNEARTRAVPLWLEAAKNGDPKAQYILGILYFNGDVVEKDEVTGYAWTLLAIDGGVPEALQSNTAMRGQLSEADLAAALSLAPNLMTGTPNQGLYSYLIGEPFPRPRTLINGIQTAGIKESETSPVIENAREESAPAGLVLPEPEKPGEVKRLDPLEEKPPFETEGQILDAGSPEIEEGGPEEEAPGLSGETQPEITIPDDLEPEGPPALGPEDSYDLGTPESPLVDPEGFDGAWSIQLTSFRKPENAEAHWQEVSSAHPELFDLVVRKILRFDLGPELGVYYRLRIGPFLDKAEADEKCRQIIEAGLDCLVIWP